MRSARYVFSICVLVIVTACSGGGPNGAMTTLPPASPPSASHGSSNAINPPGSFAASIFVANTANNDVLAFPKTASGNVSPSGAITGLDRPRAVAFHSG
jgi:hypothetical protein